MKSTDLFINWFVEYFIHEYPEIDRKKKEAVIKRVLLHNSEYITLEEVQEFDGCIKCGWCCEHQGCIDYDHNTHLCTRHDSPIHELCKTYPWGGEYGIAPLTLECRYQVSFFINYFDNLFKQYKGES